jgi:hypothetical protein
MHCEAMANLTSQLVAIASRPPPKSRRNCEIMWLGFIH